MPPTSAPVTPNAPAVAPRVRFLRGLFRAAACMSFTSALAMQAIAGPPDIEECRSLEAEKAQLAAGGVPADMSNGPEWAKANLPADRIQQILRYIFVDEQVRFRCAEIFAAAAVIKEEMEARRIAKEALEARLAWEARQAEMLKNIPPPERNPEPRTVTATKSPANSGKGIPPLPERMTR